MKILLYLPLEGLNSFCPLYRETATLKLADLIGRVGASSKSVASNDKVELSLSFAF